MFDTELFSSTKNFWSLLASNISFSTFFIKEWASNTIIAILLKLVQSLIFFISFKYSSNCFKSDQEIIHTHAFMSCSIWSILLFIIFNHSAIEDSSYFFCSFNSASSCCFLTFSSSSWIFKVFDSINWFTSSSEIGFLI